MLKHGDENMFPLEKIKQIKVRPQDFRLLQQVPLTRDDVLTHLPWSLTPTQANERVGSIVFVDIETTGLDLEAKLIELGMVHCTFSLDRHIILTVNRYFTGFEDPQEPIPAEITQLTGITNDMVQGQHFDDHEVQSFLGDSPLMVAHNAKFDRPRFERRFPNLTKLSWACSIEGIDWQALSLTTNSLDFLVKSIGFFYYAHRAYQDCLALCFLLSQKPKAMQMLFDSSQRLNYKIEAFKAPYGMRHILKRRGYQWNYTEKYWYLFVDSTERMEEHVEFLHELYDKKGKWLKVTSYSAQERFRS